MMTRLAQLKRYLHTPYYGLRRVLEMHVVGSAAQEWLWKTRHLYKGSQWAHSYRETIHHPHRRLLLAAIADFAPLHDILEVGCNAGPNLYLLAQSFPAARLNGLDINPRAIEVGQRWLREAAVCNVELAVGKADDLSRFGDRSMDLVFTDALLMYIGPDKIGKVLDEMLRVTRKGLVCVEWHRPATDTAASSYYYDAHWVHSFDALLSQRVPQATFRITRLPYEAFGDAGWGQFGAIVTVRL